MYRYYKTNHSNLLLSSWQKHFELLEIVFTKEIGNEIKSKQSKKKIACLYGGCNQINKGSSKRERISPIIIFVIHSLISLNPIDIATLSNQNPDTISSYVRF